MGIKFRLTVMNFLQFAVWGSYLVCISNFLGRVGLGDYVPWFYVAQGVVSIFMPAVIGALADKLVEPQRLLGISHLTAAASCCRPPGSATRLRCRPPRGFRPPSGRSSRPTA